MNDIFIRESTKKMNEKTLKHNDTIKKGIEIKINDKKEIVEKGYNRRRNIVISVNRCFDTIVDDNLISRTTQHGRIMRELYNTNVYDTERAADALDAVEKLLFTLRFNVPEDLAYQTFCLKIALHDS